MHQNMFIRSEDGGGPRELCLLTMMSGCELTTFPAERDEPTRQKEPRRVLSDSINPSSLKEMSGNLFTLLIQFPDISSEEMKGL